MAEAELAAPSPLFRGALDTLRAATRLGPIVDLACGRGRHAFECATLGFPCIAIDRSVEPLSELAMRAGAAGAPVSPVRADLESGHGIPCRPESCGAILVFRFLHRPLAPEIERALAPGGLLLYETFTERQRELGRGPRNPAFLLKPDELPALFPQLRVEAYDEALRGDGAREHTARLVARKPTR